MAPTNPLEIQEIVDMVASYLRGKDVAVCVCVSKSWRDSFLHHRWRTVRAGYEFGSSGCTGPGRDAVYKHRYLIHDLHLLRAMDRFLGYQYPNLRRLAINWNNCEGKNSRVLANLSMNTPTLVNLKLISVDTPPSFWNTLSTHSFIRHLSLVDLRVNVDDSKGLWRVCMKLESLEMFYVDIEDGARPVNEVFDRIRQLQLTAPEWVDDGNTPEDQCIHMYLLDLILRSPKLESLELDIEDRGFVREMRVDGDWPHLKKLKLDGCILDRHLDFIFKRGSYRPGLDTQASKALGSHFGTLVDVDLLGSVAISSSTVLDLLCFCPNLEVLLVKHVLAHSVAKRGPWVCQQLRELSIQFLMDPSDQDLQQLLFERLSTLIRLERLTLDYDYYGSGSNNHNVLEFRLDCGLERLTSLQQLRFVWLYTPLTRWWSPKLGMEDVVWMVEKWKRLETIKGDLNNDRVLTAQLRSVFESHGIAVEPNSERRDSLLR